VTGDERYCPTPPHVLHVDIKDPLARDQLGHRLNLHGEADLQSLVDFLLFQIKALRSRLPVRFRFARSDRM
jgi:hypothetical protein